MKDVFGPNFLQELIDHKEKVEQETAETKAYCEEVRKSIQRGARRTDHRFKL